MNVETPATAEAPSTVAMSKSAAATKARFRIVVESASKDASVLV